MPVTSVSCRSRSSARASWPCCRTSRATASNRPRALRLFWGALVYLGFALVSPVALVAAPLGLLLLWQRPTTRESLTGTALLAFAAWSVTSSPAGFGAAEGAWVCLLTGAAAVVQAWRPPARGPVVASGLLTIALAAGVALLLVGATAFSWDELRWLGQKHFGAQVRLTLGVLLQRVAPVGTDSATIVAIEQSADAAVFAVSRLLPGLVLVQSLAALALAWSVYRAVAREPDGEPLPRLRDLRFNDHLVWGIVAALALLVWPGQDALQLAGGNIGVFFGSLYVLRGLGVVAALAAAAGMTGPLVGLMAALVTVFLLPLALLGALALGVTDTWVDWRTLAQRTKQG